VLGKTAFGRNSFGKKERHHGFTLKMDKELYNIGWGEAKASEEP